MADKVILMVEDDPRVLAMNETMLTQLSDGAFEFIKAETLKKAREKLAGKIDIVLLDIELPDGSGLDLVPEIHAATDAPIIMLTSHRESAQIEEGLIRGGDVYITKPYRMNELYAQMLAMFRREEARAAAPQTVTRGTLTLDISSGRAFLGGGDMNLAPKEFATLHYFLRNEGKVIPKEELYHAVWNQPMAGNANALYKTVSKLKAKLEADESSTFFVRMVRNQGYEFSEK